MRRRRRAKEGQVKRKSPSLKKLCAALLRSFRGQHSEKMNGSARGNWDPREGQQPFRPNPNGAGDRITTLRRLLIGAENIVMLLVKHGLIDIIIILTQFFKPDKVQRLILTPAPDHPTESMRPR